ncbi:MAG: RNA methyltransferase [Desulfuromonas sp.]|nr:MAG: RNA methyltransferase [Desulfuromonas sp.]
MAYNPELERCIDVIAMPWPGIDKRKMFGGLGYLINGHIAFGIHKDELIVRIGCENRANKALCKPHIRPFDVTGKPIRGWVMVSPAGWEDECELSNWLHEGREHAESLAPKNKP